MRREWRRIKPLKKDASLCSVPQLQKSGINVTFHRIYDKSDMEREIQITKSFLCLCCFFVLPLALPEDKNPCHLDEAPGPCRGLVTRYLFDRRSQQCRHFFYGGCFGNANNFRSMAECQAKCLNPGGPRLNFCSFFSSEEWQPSSSDSMVLFKATN